MAESKHLLAFEIGTEEIPAFDLHSATGQLEKLVPERLAAARVPFDVVSVLSSPRRLIVLVEGVADATAAQTEEFKGPKSSIAFDAEGAPTKAASGFARGKGLSVGELERRAVDGEEYLFAVKNVPAIDVRELLPGILGDLIPSLSWPRSCRWGSQTVTFSRPVRWLLALLDDEVLPVTFADLKAGRLTRGHRFLAPGDHEVADAASLLGVVRHAAVVPSEEERERIIREGIAAIEASTGESARIPAKTLLEVVNLTEFPTPMLGTFDAAFLEVPEEIIVDAMLMHQRYFPLYGPDGRLTNKFILVSNGDPACADTIVDGNERVVRARLADAKFFYEEDKKKPLEAYVDRLDEVVFQEDLGSVRDKAERLVRLASSLAADAGLDARDAADLARALLLCKADLVTNAVVEFTSVQGVMGAYYAQASGENEQVARAIGQHYRPRFAGDGMPEGLVGKLTAFADKLDTICGLFAVDQAPNGSKDPFALRRSAIGIVRMLSDGLPVSAEAAIDASLATFGTLDFDAAEVKRGVLDFLITRTKVMLRDDGFGIDAIDAVLACGAVEPMDIVERTRALEKARSEMPEVMDDLAAAYARANNLRDPELGCEVDEALLVEAEAALIAAIAQAEGETAAFLDVGDYAAALRALAALRKPIDDFFEDVMIMDENERLRSNRLRILNRFVAVFARIADFGKMAGR